MPCLSLLCIGRDVGLRPNETFAPKPQIVFAFEKRCFGGEVGSRDDRRKASLSTIPVMNAGRSGTGMRELVAVVVSRQDPLYLYQHISNPTVHMMG